MFFNVSVYLSIEMLHTLIFLLFLDPVFSHLLQDVRFSFF